MTPSQKLERAKRSKPFRAADVVLYAAVIALTALSLFLTFRNPGQQVEIVHADKTYRYALNKDRTVDLGALTVVIRGGRVWVENADCPDKVCERSGKIGYANQTVACLPNRIVIRITGGDLAAVTGQK